jgi:hypothetical protein
LIVLLVIETWLLFVCGLRGLGVVSGLCLCQWLSLGFLSRLLLLLSGVLRILLVVLRPILLILLRVIACRLLRLSVALVVVRVVCLRLGLGFCLHGICTYGRISMSLLGLRAGASRARGSLSPCTDLSRGALTFSLCCWSGRVLIVRPTCQLHSVIGQAWVLSQDVRGKAPALRLQRVRDSAIDRLAIRLVLIVDSYTAAVWILGEIEHSTEAGNLLKDVKRIGVFYPCD